MKEMFEYKGYYGSVRYNAEDEILYGKIEFIRDLVDYQGADVQELKKAFEDSVDDYISTCKELDKEPDKPFKGSFNVRVGEELHRKAHYLAIERGISLNEVTSKALDAYVENKGQVREVYIIKMDNSKSEEIYSESPYKNRLQGLDPVNFGTVFSMKNFSGISQKGMEE